MLSASAPHGRAFLSVLPMLLNKDVAVAAWQLVEGLLTP